MINNSSIEMWNSTEELKWVNKVLIPKYLKMPKPLVKYSREKISLDFFKKRIKEITLLIQNRRDVRLFMTFCLWLQSDHPENTNKLSFSLNTKKVNINELKRYLDLINEKINFQMIPNDILEFYSNSYTKTKDIQSAQYIQVNDELAKLVVQIILQLDNPIDPEFEFIEDIFIIPDHFCLNSRSSYDNSDLWSSGMFDKINKGAQDIIKSIYNLLTYFAEKFSGSQEHFLRMSATLFWCTRPEPVYSLEIFGLLTEMFGEHKLNTRSSQLCDKCTTNVLINCEKKVGSKNRSSIYFRLSTGAEWIIAYLFPDKRVIIQQQAVAISFLRYSKQILTCPWTINPMNFNYLMDIWFRSFLYSDNLDEIVYEKARELKRHIHRKDFVDFT